MKATTSYETVLAAECSVSGCEIILEGEVSASAKKPRFLRIGCAGDAGKGKSLLTLALLAGVAVKSFYSIEIPSFARNDPGVEMRNDFPQDFCADNSILGYREYEAAFAAVYPKQEIRVGVENCTGYEENACQAARSGVRDENDTAHKHEEIIRAGDTMEYRYEERGTGRTVKPVIYTDYQGISGDGICMEEDSRVEFCVDVEEEGFYELSLEYVPFTGSDSAMECSILIDGEIPYRELACVCYDRIWTRGDHAKKPYGGDADLETDGMSWDSATRDTQPSEAGYCQMEQAEWITGITYDRERRIAEPLSVYLTKGGHKVSLISIKEPMVLHRIIFSPKRQVQEYRRVKGFWDAVGIRAAQGTPVVIEAEQADRASVQVEYPEREEVGMSAMPLRLSAHVKEKECSTIGGGSWDKAGSWFEWEFEVEEAGYYHISMYFRQNYAREGAYRKIMLDGTVPFQEMERRGFAYGWGWKEEALADDTGDPYVFYIKAGRHTLRIEAVPGGADAENAGIEQVQPLEIDWIHIVPAGNVGTKIAGD